MIRQAALANVVVVSREMGSMMTCLWHTLPPLTLEKAAAVEPPDLPPLDIDDLTSKSDDSAPLSVNDQVRLDFMVGMGNPPNEIPPTNSYNIIKLYSSLNSSIFSFEKFYLYPQFIRWRKTPVTQWNPPYSVAFTLPNYQVLYVNEFCSL